MADEWERAVFLRPLPGTSIVIPIRMIQALTYSAASTWVSVCIPDWNSIPPRLSVYGK